MFSREFSAIFHTTKEEPSLKVSVFVMSVRKNVSKISKYCFLIGRLGSSLLVYFSCKNCAWIWWFDAPPERILAYCGTLKDRKILRDCACA